METKTGDMSLDNIIPVMISAASRAIIDVCQRELAPQSASGTVRKVHVEGPFVDLVPYDLQTATLVQLDPDVSPVTLNAHVDYELYPAGGDKAGTYTHIRLTHILSLFTSKRF